MKPYEYLGRALAATLTVAAVHAESPPPPSAHRQLPHAMHGSMQDRPVIKVGLHEGDFTGADQRALQAALDYVAGLGGGTVEIGEGVFELQDSLHLRSHVTLRGQGEKTVLHKGRSATSPLELDGDYGEEQFTVRAPAGFHVGDGVTIRDKNSGGFHTTVARITGRTGNTFAISTPLNADCMVSSGATAETVFPVISGYHAEEVRLERITIDGNKAENSHMDGCRGGGIFLYRCPGTVISQCVVRAFNGDGISFQQSNDVQVTNCLTENNASLGFHPGSGSQRPHVSECVARANGEDGLFLCWRVKNGIFENNLLEGNGRFGISIGHKDTDNLLRSNRVIGNHEDGIFFRNESAGMAGHRNRIEDNLIENNGLAKPAAGIRVRGETGDLVLKGNTIRDTRPEKDRQQTTGIRLEENVGAVVAEGNVIDAHVAVEDERKVR